MRLYLDRDTVLEKDHIDEILESGSKTILLHKEDNHQADYAIIHNTLQKDPTNSEKEAVEHIYRQFVTLNRQMRKLLVVLSISCSLAINDTT